MSEQYDDNIDLVPDDEEDDWITRVGPGLTLAFLLEETEVRLSYDIYFSYYAKNDEENDVSHSLTLTGLKGIPVAENVTLDLDETFRVSEDPIEVSEQTNSSSTRRTRDRYYRNNAGVRVNYLFGEEDFLYIGSRHLLLINDGSEYEDSQELRAEAGIAYWFTIRHGVSLDYEYARADFDVSEDFDKHNGRFTYRYRFSPRVQSNTFYAYDSVDFDGRQEDYQVHNAGTGLDLEVSENSSLSVSGGYYHRDRERSDDNDGFMGSFLFHRIFARGSLDLEASTGYEEVYIEAENLGFTEYYRASASLNYQLLERLTANISGFFQRDEYVDVERDDDTWQGQGVLNYSLLPWLSSSLSYQYRRVESNLQENEYTDNRVTLTFVASYLSEPKPF